MQHLYHIIFLCLIVIGAVRFSSTDLTSEKIVCGLGIAIILMAIIITQIRKFTNQKIPKINPRIYYPGWWVDKSIKHTIIVKKDLNDGVWKPIKME